MTPERKQALLNLADRCEREESTLSLRCAIAKALGWRERIYGHHLMLADPNGRVFRLSQMPDWLGSIDVAKATLPEGDDVFWQVGHDGEGPDPSLFIARVLVCSRATPATGHIARATRPAPALTAAALRAIAASEE